MPVPWNAAILDHDFAHVTFSKKKQRSTCTDSTAGQRVYWALHELRKSYLIFLELQFSSAASSVPYVFIPSSRS